jgi:hypothetical protein
MVIAFMIDTIVLLLPQHTYQITDPNKFVPSAGAKAMAGTSARSHHYFYGMQTKQNPTKKELLAGIYKPKAYFVLSTSWRKASNAENRILTTKTILWK